MNRNLGTPIHESNLVPGHQYYLKIAVRGEGIVTVLKPEEAELYFLDDHSTPVQIVEGGFNSPGGKRNGKKDVMGVAPDQGKFYELR